MIMRMNDGLQKNADKIEKDELGDRGQGTGDKGTVFCLDETIA